MDIKTITAYNLHTQDYDAETEYFWAKFPRDFIKEFIGSSGPGILDIGSGPGRDAELLRNGGAAVTCLDASEAMVKITRDKNFTSICADFDKLPFADSEFDGVWSYTSLLHVPKSQIAIPLAEIYRVLKPGGYLALGMVQGSHDGYRSSSGITEPRWFSFYEPDEIETLLIAAGFSIEKLIHYKPGEKLNYLNYLLKKPTSSFRP